MAGALVLSDRICAMRISDCNLRAHVMICNRHFVLVSPFAFGFWQRVCIGDWVCSYFEL